ncbi:MAG: ABC transporter ATP-binding protein [Pseudobdellovibrionaceae bacterium]
MAEILKISSLEKTYHLPRFLQKPVDVCALRGVSFELAEGETLAIVGESGCGKSTLAKVIVGLESASSGSAAYLGKGLETLSPQERSEKIQLVFQDPYSSLNPRKRVMDLIAEPLVIKNTLSPSEIKNRVSELMLEVGLRPEFATRYPHMFSGGQRQRIGIARALILKPKVIVCDEPVSALDVSVQAQVLNLLRDLQQKEKLTYIFISHDLSVVRFIAHRVAVMYLGKIVEISDKKSLFEKPRHPYSLLLLESTPKFGQGVSQNEFKTQEMPSPTRIPSGCSFHTRCPFATETCKAQVPELRSFLGGQVACHHAEKVAGV